jgi:peptidoglycan/xylan/chitin deacetylase (PgdA/CDA1 family)
MPFTAHHAKGKKYWFDHRNKMNIPIITYHAIGDAASPLWTSADAFDQQLKALAGNGFETISLSDAIRACKGELPVYGEAAPGMRALPQKPLVLTFDDGYASVAEQAWQRLSHWGFSATVFLVTDYCGKTNYWPGQPRTMPEMPLLTWKQIEDLSADGCEFGAHTKDHCALPLLSRQAIAEQLSASQAAITARTGQPANTFAYPYGVSDAKTIAVTSEYFAGAVGTALGIASEKDNLFLLPRIDSYYLNTFWIERLHTQTFSQYIKLRQILRTTKRLVQPDYVPAPLQEVPSARL